MLYRKQVQFSWFFFVVLLNIGQVYAGDSVPTEVQLPGTQPFEVYSLTAVDICAQCHGGYDAEVEPVHNWRGAMMAHASRDPLFWAAMAIVEQDFEGAGNLCSRCHNAGGWLEGRAIPTDGSVLSDTEDRDGVECHLCHRLTNPDNSEHLGIQYPPFLANDEGEPPVGYYGSSEYVLWNGLELLGPYADAIAQHDWEPSRFHRSAELCGTCHDVSNPVTGDLAHNNAAQVPLEPGTYSGILGAPIEEKAGFNNFPYQYGMVERTYSEHKASSFAETLVSEYAKLPTDLQAGAIKLAYEAALLAGRDGDYEDGTLRYFTCQSCHMRPVVGQGAKPYEKKGEEPPLRADLPWHDLTGSNYWVPDAILYLDSKDRLPLAGELSGAERVALNEGKLRAKNNLENAVSLSLRGDIVRIVNLTGHKMPSGGEGRRMWLNIKWFDQDGRLLREDGAYAPITVKIDGQPTRVETLVDLHDPNTKVYEIHPAITQEWANQLIELGYSKDLPVQFDRVTGEVVYTLGQIAEQEPGSYVESFHLALDNYLALDNRIPPFAMRYDEALVRNILPVPADQYGNPGPGGIYDYWDEILLNPPADAVSATIKLLSQPTGWEYVQFLYLANNGANPNLANLGQDLLEAWLNTGMAAPHVIASAQWKKEESEEE